LPSLILLLGGKGTRFGGKKQFLTYKGKFLFELLLERIENLFTEIVLVAPEGDIGRLKEKFPRFKFAKSGRERQFSVFNGLKEVTQGVVVVHDGARPLAGRRLFEEALKLDSCDGKIPVIPLRDTVKEISPTGEIVKTLPREKLVAVQTPQGFKTEILKECHRRALKENFLATDDAALLERYGKRVCTFKGEFSNLKITYPEDWEIARCLLKSWEKS
jgi:2-C-methyl-D-erythritol 4-phosphate cytidylyltransferase